MEDSSSYLPASSPSSPARHDGWTPERQRGFCEVLAESGRVEQAAASVGMSREGAYKLRRRADGRAFATAWDAALLLARQRLIDETFALAFDGAVDQVIRDGRVIHERRRRDPRMLLTTIERLTASSALGNPAAQAVAQEFDEFLDCMETDAAVHTGASADFMEVRAGSATTPQGKHIQNRALLLKRGDERARGR